MYSYLVLGKQNKTECEYSSGDRWLSFFSTILSLTICILKTLVITSNRMHAATHCLNILSLKKKKTTISLESRKDGKGNRQD